MPPRNPLWELGRRIQSASPSGDAGRPAHFLQAQVEVLTAMSNGLGHGILWWEPVAKGPLERRGLFDADNNALQAIYVLDSCMR